MRTTPLLLMTVGAILLAGCNSRPRAPVLRDDPVYQNDREGFRFLAPEGWTQNARADVPAGKVEQERPLVSYRQTTGKAMASLRVSLIDLPASTDLAAYLSEPSFGADHWNLTAPAQDTPVGSISGVRYTFTARVGQEESAKDVVAVRQGERVYFFTALYPAKDTEVRDMLHRVVASVIWKK